MQIIEPYMRILDIINGIELLRKIEWYGRISHRSEEKQGEESWKRFIEAVVLQHGDWSIVEHEKITVDALVDRGITHEIVRHRIGSYTQESTRFCNYGKSGEIKVIRSIEDNDDWYTSMKQCEVNYLSMLARGVSPQIARSVLPNSLASRIIITYNLRTWRHFFVMRTCKEAHPQMRQVTIPLLKEFQETIPLLYDDIIPEQRQIDMMRLPR